MSNVNVLADVVKAARNEGNVVMVTGKPGCGKSKLVREAATQEKWVYVNCRELITEKFLAVPAADRGLYAPDIFAEDLKAFKAGVVVLDDLQTLFVPVFHVNVDSLLRKLSKSKTIVAVWPGVLDGGMLCYDKFDGSEAIRISPDGFKVFDVK